MSLHEIVHFVYVFANVRRVVDIYWLIVILVPFKKPERHIRVA